MIFKIFDFITLFPLESVLTSNINNMWRSTIDLGIKAFEKFKVRLKVICTCVLISTT